MNIKIEDVIGVYLATTTNDNQTIAEVGCEIVKLCQKIEEEVGIAMPIIKVNDVAMFAYINYSFVKLKNDNNGFLRVIVTDSYNKRKNMKEKSLSNLPLEIKNYFTNIEPTFVKKNN